MKKFILTAIIAATAGICSTTAEAGGCATPSYNVVKIYKVQTFEVNRSRIQKMAYDRCGRAYCYWVTVVTYCDVYSNGQRRVWTRTV